MAKWKWILKFHERGFGSGYEGFGSVAGWGFTFLYMRWQIILCIKRKMSDNTGRENER